MRFVDIRNDIAFRKIFGNEKKTVSLISFINTALKLEKQKRIVSVKIENANQFPRIAGEKASVIDVTVTDQRGRQFAVEIQITDKNGFNKRIKYYTSGDYSMPIKQEDDYIKLNPTHFIGILDFNFGIGTKELEVIPENTDDDGLKEAYIDAEKYKWNKSELITYDNAFMRIQDAIGELSHAREEGRKQGRKERNAKMVIGCYDVGVSPKDIAKVLKMSLDEVLEIIEQHQK